MQAIGGIEQILVDHFKPYRVETSNRFERPHTILVLIFPVALSVLMGVWFSEFIAVHSAVILAIYAVMASVLTAVMPTIHGLIGTVDPKRIEVLRDGSVTSDENILEAGLLIAKIEVIRSLYAAVAWSVIVLSVSLFPLLLICHGAFIPNLTAKPPLEPTTAACVVRGALSAMIAFAGITAFVALFQIVSGVHLMVRQNQVGIESDLRKLKKRYRL